MNWNKPLPKGEADNALKLSSHHELSFTMGYEWRELVGATGKYDFYTMYLSYCKVMSSPLVQALS